MTESQTVAYQMTRSFFLKVKSHSVTDEWLCTWLQAAHLLLHSEMVYAIFSYIDFN